MLNFTIWLDVDLSIPPYAYQVMLNINVFRYIDKPGSFSYNAESDYDYFGYKEIDFEIMFGEGEAEDGNLISLNEQMLDKILEMYEDEIEQKLWDKIDGLGEFK